MLYETEIPFKWKGGRNYVHGTDLYDSSLRITKQYFGKYPNKISASFHKLLQHNGILRIYQKMDEIYREDLFSFFEISVDDTQYYISYTPSKTPVTSRYEYDEKDVLDGMNFNDNEIIVNSKTRYTYIEQMVAMTKKLHTILYKEGKGKLLFSKIELNDSIAPELYREAEIIIRAAKNFNFKLTQNLIILNNKESGQIWFSYKN